MKLVILLLLCCCVVALAKPDGSKEVAPAKHGSKEDKHSGSGESKETSEGSSEGSSHESDDKSGDKSSNESGGGQGIILPEPTSGKIIGPRCKRGRKSLGSTSS